MSKPRPPAVRRLALVSLLLLGAVVLGFVAWAELVPAPQAPALAALQSDAQVRVTAGRWLEFQPIERAPETGLVLYPGGRVDARAYAPAARAIAAAGYLVVIVPMPLHLAVFAPGRASDVIAAFPEITRWAVGGHSLGGAMAADFAAKHPAQVQGLVLWAAYPPASVDLSRSALAVVSISGTRDGLATPAKLDASRALLPAGTRWVSIGGGNHAQFGWYGPQSGDQPASISPEAQQAQIVAATVELLAQLK